MSFPKMERMQALILFFLVIISIYTQPTLIITPNIEEEVTSELSYRDIIQITRNFFSNQLSNRSNDFLLNQEPNNSGYCDTQNINRQGLKSFFNICCLRPPGIPHSPIVINNDTDFANQALTEGWIGDGSEESPFKIQQYDILSSSEHAIEILNTRVYFEIEECLLQGPSSFAGVCLENVSNAFLTRNLCLGMRYGIELQNCSLVEVYNCSTNSNGYYGIYSFSSNSNIIRNSKCLGNSHSGIYMLSSNSSEIANCNCSSNGNYGVFLEDSTNNELKNCTFNANQYGIFIEDAILHNQINNSTFNNEYSGIWSLFSDYLFVANNTFFDGLYLDYSDSNIIKNNRFFGYESGVNLFESANNTLINNQMEGYGFQIDRVVSDCRQWNVSENFVNGRPIIFWQDKVGGIVPIDVAQIILVNCSFVTVRDLFLSECIKGIIICDSIQIMIINNTCVSMDDGIVILGGASNYVTNNTCMKNRGYGLYIEGSDNFVINNTCKDNWASGICIEGSGNQVVDNTLINQSVGIYRFGIYLHYGYSNNISNNLCLNNWEGIKLMHSEGNYITNNYIAGAYHSTSKGIHIYGMSGHNTVVNNTVSYNLDGIFIYGGTATDN
ncbi:MAG: right-handed parallel beta-helix repeat-containing protein, partial [Promethearchaeota archaeon]